jgi:hypothetical protein
MERNSFPFKWRHFEPAIVLLCVRWYCRYCLSFRDLADTDARSRIVGSLFNPLPMGASVRAPETNKRIRPHLRTSGTC